MGKFMRKCKGNCEVAVMEGAEVGVRTRARALALSAVDSRTAKRRKVDDDDDEGFKLSSSVSHLRGRHKFLITPEDSVSQVNAENSALQTGSNDQCSSASSDDIPTSCCSSNRSIEEEESVEIEPSTYNFDCSRQSKETTPSSEVRSESGELESTATAKPSEANSRRQDNRKKMPSAAELEEFFAAEEKEQQKRFAEKYNFDFVKEVPLEGRFEWVKLKP